jgi:tetratricopeptide (TPR) repeat protein
VEGPDDKLFAKVMGRLLASDLAATEYPKKYVWPPHCKVMPESDAIVNAFATAAPELGATFDQSAGKIRPIVLVTKGMLKQIVKGDENSLAVIMGHELAHLSKDHVGNRKGETQLLALAFNRDQEIEADVNGLRYAVAAGYPYKVGVASALNAMRQVTRATSFEGLSQTHPTWEDRLAILDREQPKIWSAMSAFQNGFLFLHLEQYLAAQQCFKAVVAEFPDCHEGWANLGYAQLMQYCDGLDADDLEQYGIGPIAAGAFYSRPASLESKVRGIDEKLWKDAVKALDKALALKPDLVLPRASLGLAYLVHPEGKQLKKASQYFKDAQEGLVKDAEFKQNPVSLAAVLVNSGVADAAKGDAVMAKEKFNKAGRILSDEPLFPVVRTMEDTVDCNLALLEARAADAGAKRKACALLEQYLANASPDSAWWAVMYKRYGKLAKETNTATKPKEELAQRKVPTALRLVVSVTLGSEALTLSEPTKNAVARLGSDVVEQPLYPDSKIIRCRSAERGIDVLAKERVLAIFLVSDRAPPVLLRAQGQATKGRELRVGMGEKEAEELLKDQRAEKGKQAIADAKVDFRFYPELGLGIRFADGRVAELAIAQIPRRSFFVEDRGDDDNKK